MSPQNRKIVIWFYEHPDCWLTTWVATIRLRLCRLSERMSERELGRFKTASGQPMVQKKWIGVGKRRVMGYYISLSNAAKLLRK